MKLIVGLGNPGREYANTRHNVGWWFLDHLADVWRLDGWRRDGEAVVADARFGNERVRLMKPQTYMNLSGAALRPYLRRPLWSPSHDLLVVVDEVALAVGTFRFRSRGSAGGHNGLKSVEAALDTPAYARLRIGIGPDHPVRDLADFVLSPVSKGDRALVLGLFETLTEAIDVWRTGGIELTMNRFNARGTPKTPDDNG